jgi:hypothetical protein
LYIQELTLAKMKNIIENNDDQFANSQITRDLRVEDAYPGKAQNVTPDE